MKINYDKYSDLFLNYQWSIENEEKPSWDLIKTYLKPEFVFFDIGCQRGIYTSGVSDFLQNNCTIHSFDVLEHPIMKKIVENNSNIFFNNIALGDGGKHKCVIDYNSNTEVKSSTLKLDDYVIENNINKIDFIKIDVDGLQNIVIDGSDYILKNLKPILMIEMNSNFGNSITLTKNYIDRVTNKNDLNLFNKLFSYDYISKDIRNGNNVFFTPSTI